jgi:N-acetylmuramoyl-L-alanine amidase
MEVDAIVTISGNDVPGCLTGLCASGYADGTETLISPAASDAAKDLATRVQARAVAALGTGDRGVRVDVDDYAILSRTAAPSVELFYGFVRDPADMARAGDPATQQALGRELLHAIQGHFGLAESTP